MIIQELGKNQDLFRASLAEMEPEAVSKALNWLRGEAPYPYPTSVHYNITLRCTARCNHCSQWSWPAHPELTLVEINRLMELFRSWGVKTITFGGGNPLLHGYFIEALQIAHQAGMEIGIITEGVNMSAPMIDAICDHAAWIRFSLDGPNPQIHDQIRSAPGLFATVIASISDLQRRKTGVRIGLNCVVQKRNIHCLDEMIELGERLGVTAVLFKVSHGDDPAGRFLPSHEDWEGFVQWVGRQCNLSTAVATNVSELHRLMGTVFRAHDAVRGRPVQSFYRQGDVRCFVPLFFLVCDSEANAYPCDYLQADTRAWKGRYEAMRDEFCLGNLLEDSGAVLERLSALMRHRIRNLPCSGYNECGCCTRFCQINASLTDIEARLGASAVTPDMVRDYVAQMGRAEPSHLFF
ncbi:MAG TPA: radical SAM protein [Terriglobia bacterium]|nr:radical SAM protein [Terriglobia bacterium]